MGVIHDLLEHTVTAGSFTCQETSKVYTESSILRTFTKSKFSMEAAAVGSRIVSVLHPATVSSVNNRTPCAHLSPLHKLCLQSHTPVDIRIFLDGCSDSVV